MLSKQGGKPIIDVIIPAFNEQEAVGEVIKDIPDGLVREVIVVNNNSTDRTSRPHQARALRCSMKGNKVMDMLV